MKKEGIRAYLVELWCKCMTGNPPGNRRDLHEEESYRGINFHRAWADNEFEIMTPFQASVEILNHIDICEEPNVQ